MINGNLYFSPNCKKCVYYRGCLKCGMAKDVADNKIWFCSDYYRNKQKNKGKTQKGERNAPPMGD